MQTLLHAMMTSQPDLTPPARPVPQAVGAEAPRKATRVVLYVEDDPVNVMLMQGILELHSGCELQVARSGAEARQRVRQGPLDLVLCDHRLPDIAGDKLLAQLRTAGLPAAVPALLVTAETDDVAADLAWHGGFDGFWTKPLDVAATLRSLERWLGS